MFKTRQPLGESEIRSRILGNISSAGSISVNDVHPNIRTSFDSIIGLRGELIGRYVIMVE